MPCVRLPVPTPQRAVSAAGVYGWIGPDLANFRVRGGPTRFAAVCNQALVAHGATTTSSSPTSTTPTSTTTRPITLPGGPYLKIADVCLAWRVTARALYGAGPDPTQRSLVRALYRLPFVDNATGRVRTRAPTRSSTSRMAAPASPSSSRRPSIRASIPAAVTHRRRSHVLGAGTRMGTRPHGQRTGPQPAGRYR